MSSSLGHLVDEAVWQAACALAGELLCDDELRAFCTGLDDAEWNGVHRARPRPSTPPADLVARATALFAGRPFTWHLGAGSDPAMGAALADLPFEEEEPGMVATLDHRHETMLRPPSGVELVAVSTDEQLRDWVEVLAGGPGQEALTAVRRPAALGGPAPHVLAVVGGKPVGCAAVFLTEAAAVVDHVVTARQARNRGIGTLLTRWALATAHRAGQHTAVLTASPQGEGIYERFGFRAASVVRRYRSPAA
jgi:ribosomal protein S18 acetylase RimI-like enzyme